MPCRFRYLLLAPALALSGCQTTELTYPSGAERILVVDRHLLISGGSNTTSGDGGIISISRKIDSPKKQSRLPAWLASFDRDLEELLYNRIVAPSAGPGAYPILIMHQGNAPTAGRLIRSRWRTTILTPMLDKRQVTQRSAQRTVVARSRFRVSQRS